MTDIEILTDSVNTLGTIQVPVAFFETIGMPVSRVRRNLIALLNAIQQQSKEDQNLIKMEGDAGDGREAESDAE